MISLWSNVGHFLKGRKVGGVKYYLSSVFDSYIFLKWEKLWLKLKSYEFLFFLSSPSTPFPGKYFGIFVNSYAVYAFTLLLDIHSTTHK